MKTLITVQHTQSEHHVNGMVGSWTDWHLTELGRRQADGIGRKLAAELAGKDAALYASDLLRARQTAEIIGGHLGLAPALRPELRERNLGRACGRSVQWLREHIERPERTVDDRLFADGESRRDAWNRLKPFFESVLAAEHETVLIVSHGDILSVFYAMFLGLGVESLEHTVIHGRAGSVSEMSVGGDGKRFVRRLGDLSYLS